MLYAMKVLLAAAIIVAVTQVSKVSTFIGALINSLPIISIIALTWIYVESGDVQRIGAVSEDTFWLVLPTLPMFLALPALLRAGVSFYLSMILCVALTAACYALMLWVLRHAGITLG